MICVIDLRRAVARCERRRVALVVGAARARSRLYLRRVVGADRARPARPSSDDRRIEAVEQVRGRPDRGPAQGVRAADAGAVRVGVAVCVHRRPGSGREHPLPAASDPAAKCWDQRGAARRLAASTSGHGRARCRRRTRTRGSSSAASNTRRTRRRSRTRRIDPHAVSRSDRCRGSAAAGRGCSAEVAAHRLANGSPEICISPAASMCSRVTNRVLLTAAVTSLPGGAASRAPASTSIPDGCDGVSHAASAARRSARRIRTRTPAARSRRAARAERAREHRSVELERAVRRGRVGEHSVKSPCGATPEPAWKMHLSPTTVILSLALQLSTLSDEYVPATAAASDSDRQRAGSRVVGAGSRARRRRDRRARGRGRDLGEVARPRRRARRGASIAGASRFAPPPHAQHVTASSAARAITATADTPRAPLRRPRTAR